MAVTTIAQPEPLSKPPVCRADTMRVQNLTDTGATTRFVQNRTLRLAEERQKWMATLPDEVS
jgi:hypothetical protein